MQSVNRKCKICLIEKPLNKFTKNKACDYGREHTCRVCTSKRALKWEYSNTDKHRNSYYKSKFGITLEQYNEMLTVQNNVCNICKKPETDKNKKYLAVDHCHKTGKIRGLLCRTCNTMLGTFDDNLELFNRVVNHITYGYKYMNKCK